MRSSFAGEIAPKLVRRHPGQPARYYAELALSQGLITSRSEQDPVFSLASSLAKYVRERRVQGIVARREAGELRYFPVDVDERQDIRGAADPAAQPEQSATESAGAVVTAFVPAKILEILDSLVDIGRNTSRGEALARLAQQWVEQNPEGVQRIARARQQVRQIRNSL